MKNNKVMEFLDFNGVLSAVKENDYKNTLAVAALIELLADKGFISKKDFSDKAREIECADLAGIITGHRAKTTK